MSVFLAPVGLSAAPVSNRLSFQAIFKEKLCKTVCAVSTNQPRAEVTYRTETPVLNGTTVFIPIVATVVLTIPGCGCQAITQTITERFSVSFQDQTALPTAVTITSEGQTQGLIKVVCGKSNCFGINESLAVTITPPETAAA